MRRFTLVCPCVYHGHHEVEAEETVTPGLAVHPFMVDGKIRPDIFAVSHTASGTSILFARSSRDAHDIARDLGPLCDWTRGAYFTQRDLGAFLRVSAYARYNQRCVTGDELGAENAFFFDPSEPNQYTDPRSN